MTFRGRVQNGVVILENKAKLAEGTAVRVHPLNAPPGKNSRGKALGRRLMKYAGRAKGLPRDMARNHDHYIHGTARR